MSKPQQKIIINSLLKLHFKSLTKPPFTQNLKPPFRQFHRLSTFSSNGVSKFHLNPTFQSNPISQNVTFRQYFSCLMKNHVLSDVKMMGFEKMVFDPLKIRRYSTSIGRKVSGVRVNGVGNLGEKVMEKPVSEMMGFERMLFDPLRIRRYSTNIGRRVSGVRVNGGGNLGKKVMEKPLSIVNSTFVNYKEAIGLQLEGFWKRNYLFVFGAGAVFVCIMLWRIMFGIANTFVGLSEGMAKYGFLALSASMVAFAGLYLRSRHTINPDKVYRMAMRELNTSASILEVMGSPLTGTDLRAYVMSGGGLSLSKFKPRLRSKRCFLIFPIRGSEMKGLVSVEVKKSKGKYDMKLLAVDIPMASGPDQRLFLFGDEEEYKVGGGLISELRDPVVKAMAATKELEEKDDVEAEEDEERELQDAEKKHQQEINKLGKDKAWNWKWWQKL